MPKKSTLPVHQANGQTEKKYRSLDELFGGGDLHERYKTLDLDVYIKSLDEMNMAEIQSHARLIGLMPIDDVKRMKKTLIEEFKSFAKTYKMPQDPQQLNQSVVNKNRVSELPKNIKDILAEGA